MSKPQEINIQLTTQQEGVVIEDMAAWLAEQEENK